MGETVLDQQKLLGYFIEETKENLETIEQGILDLSSAMEDSERINEMFRAAHTVKGGAGMLGYSSIQKAAHKLEDAFKVLRDNSTPVTVDNKLESLFLSGFDVLRDLIDKLQGTFGLKDEEAMTLVEAAEPTFVDLQSYLHQLSQNPAPAKATATASPAAINPFMETRQRLKEMLTIFRQSATPDNREQLKILCSQLAEFHISVAGWQTLVKLAQKAIANPQHSYRTLAPIIIKEIKQGSDYLELGQPESVASSNELKRLAESQLPQILVSVDPEAITQALRQVFTSQQLSQISQLLR
ncbi:MAG: Hpt domain-containing protein [Microcystaceae cyanobacterium]